jgi:anti-anti-sigma factor
LPASLNTTFPLKDTRIGRFSNCNQEQNIMDRKTARITATIFEIEQDRDTIILTPVTDLSELAFQRIEAGAQDVLDLLDRLHTLNVVMDFRKTEYFGSTALVFFVRVWKRTKGLGGRMAFCNVSVHEKEILQITKLDALWLIRSSREEAISAVRDRSGRGGQGKVDYRTEWPEVTERSCQQR